MMIRQCLKLPLVKTRFFMNQALLRPSGLKFAKNFHNSLVVQKKAKVKTSAKKGKRGPGHSQEEEMEADGAPGGAIEIDLEIAEERFLGVIEKFSKAANEAKLGKTSPNVFDKLKVETSDGEVRFTDIAHTTVKGRNFLITVFDPSNIQGVINSVLSSNLNMNPQVDPSNKQQLKVPLPPLTTESKKENAKQLKAYFEKVKNGLGKGNSSLATIRSEVRIKFQKDIKKKKSSDDDEKVLKAFEQLHKTYVDKLAEVYKAAGQAILK